MANTDDWDNIGSDFYNPGQSPADQPAPTAPAAPKDPWTPQELAESQQWANQYFTSHQIPAGWGTPDDLANTYLQQRRNGVGHQAAMDATPGLLGWDKYVPATPKPAAPATTDPGGGNTGAPGPTSTTLGNLLDPFTNKITDYAPGPAFNPTTDLPAAPTLNLPAAQTYGPGLSANEPPPFAFPDFAYQDFAAPTADQVQAEPGYAFGLKTGNQQITNDRAASGLLRSGATLKDFIGYGNDYATGRYTDTWNRMFNTWGANRSNDFGNWTANRQNQLDAYNTNWGVTKDVGADQLARAEATNTTDLARAQATFAPSMTAWQTLVPAIQRASEDKFDQAFQTWGRDFDIDKFNKQWPYQVLSDQQKIGLSAAM